MVALQDFQGFGLKMLKEIPSCYWIQVAGIVDLHELFDFWMVNISR